MTEAIIRRARPDELCEILKLYRHLHPDDLAPTAAHAEKAWSALMASSLNVVIVAELGNELVASCTLAVIPNLTRQARPYAVIENVVTHANHRRRGLGHAVLRSALDAAWQVDCYKVMLATSSRREETLSFYESAGFERNGKTFFQVRREHPIPAPAPPPATN